MAAVGLVLLLLVALLFATWPPRGAPHWWRHGTRPLRRRLRPGHYRTW